jgi:succinoglycan biosynthesis transport protein ExoP
MNTMDQETLRRMEAIRIEAQADYVQLNKLYSSLTNLSKAEFKRAIQTANPDQHLAVLLEEQAKSEQKKALLEPDYSADHPEMQRVNKLLEALDRQIEDRLNGILLGIKTRVESFEARAKELGSQVDEAKAKDLKAGKRMIPYLDAKKEFERATQVYDALTMRVVAAKVDNIKMPSSPVKLVDKAEAIDRAVRPNKTLNIILGVVAGLILGVGLAFFIEYLDTSVKTIDDVERALQAPVLGVIPQNVGNLLDEGPESPHSEAYRVLRTNLLFSRKDDTWNTLTVVSAGAGEGKSTTLFNLAVIFAQNEARVLLVDSDLRRPSLHKRMNVSNSVGLTNYLLKQNSLVEVIQTTSLATLDFMPSGKLPSSAMGILNSAAMKEMIAELKRRYDFVFFDSPPIMGISDASILASEVDMTLQIIQYRRYPQPMTIRAKQMIEKVGGNLMGIVLNNINMSSDSYYYYYSGYFEESYYKHDEEKKPKTPAKGKKSGSAEEPAAVEVEIKQKY